MGGAATKAFQTERISLPKMNKIEQELGKMVELSKRKGLLPKGLKWGIPLSFSDKDSFGDVDFLSTVPQDKIALWLQAMEKKGIIRIKGVVKNGWTMRHYALSLKGDDQAFQLDTLYAKSKKEFDHHFHYLSYNILGNLIGKIAAYHNLLFGMGGLNKAVYWDNAGNLHEVQRMKNRQDPNQQGFTDKTILSLKYKNGTFFDNLEFLGFDPDRYHQGFQSLQDIFTYVAQSKYFCQEAFLLENISSKEAYRDKKSDNYQLFLDFIQNLPEKKGQEQKTLQDLYKDFPHLPQQVRHLSKQAKREAQNKSKYNALAVKLKMATYGVVFDNTQKPYLSQETLIVPNWYFSVLMPKVKDWVGNIDMQRRLSNLSQQQVMTEMSSLLEQFANQWKTEFKNQSLPPQSFKP